MLDEPFGALDEVTRAEMQELLLKVVRDFGTAALLVTHDIDEALLLADRVLLLGGAPARQIGIWDVTLPKPRQDYVAELGSLRIEILPEPPPRCSPPLTPGPPAMWYRLPRQ